MGGKGRVRADLHAYQDGRVVRVPGRNSLSALGDQARLATPSMGEYGATPTANIPRPVACTGPAHYVRTRERYTRY